MHEAYPQPVALHIKLGAAIDDLMSSYNLLNAHLWEGGFQRMYYHLYDEVCATVESEEVQSSAGAASTFPFFHICPSSSVPFSTFLHSSHPPFVLFSFPSITLTQFLSPLLFFCHALSLSLSVSFCVPQFCSCEKSMQLRRDSYIHCYVLETDEERQIGLVMPSLPRQRPPGRSFICLTLSRRIKDTFV